MMKSDLKYKGFWWLPDTPNEKFAGDLDIDSTGIITLTLLDYRSEIPLHRKKEIAIINGYARNKSTKKDLAFTLFNSVIFSNDIGGLSAFTFKCQYATTLKQYHNVDELRIGSIFIRTQLLNEWVELSGKTELEDIVNNKMDFTLRYKQPDAITLLSNNEFHLYIWANCSYSTNRNSFVLKEEPRINIEFKKTTNFAQVDKYIKWIHNFISFCISLPTAVQEISYHEYTSAEMKKSKSTHQHSYDLIISDNRTYTNRDRIRDNVLIDYDTFIQNPSVYISKWIELNQKIEPVLKLYFDTLYNTNLYAENAFLNNVAALEIYHRINTPNFDGKDNSYAKKLNAIISKLSSSNDKRWLLARLEKRQETSLYNRLLDIVNKTPKISKRILKDLNLFAQKVSNTRHYLTHYDYKNKEKGIAEDAELYELIAKTRILIQIQILLDLGFVEKEIDTFIRKAISNWYNWNQ